MRCAKDVYCDRYYNGTIDDNCWKLEISGVVPGMGVQYEDCWKLCSGLEVKMLLCLSWAELLLRSIW